MPGQYDQQYDLCNNMHLLKHRVTTMPTPLGPPSSWLSPAKHQFDEKLGAFYETSFFLDSGGGAWVHGVRQLFPAPQHQCDPSSDLPPGKDNR